ncbi:diguanylate cyclase [Sodalis sp. RH21]|uniref:diguanylate cyclase n=1 Tax=unclassified Sodalis (in: enterobacteria) TaxID=2636512 RepID=UPI0039B56C59
MNVNKDTSTYNNKGIWIFITAATLLLFGLSLICLKLSQHIEPLSPLWLATAVMLAALFLSHYRYWPWFIIGAALGLVAAQAVAGGPILASLPLMAITLAEAAGGAWLLKCVLNQIDPLDNIYAWLKFFLIGVLLVPALGALSAGYFADTAPGGFFNFALRWFSAAAVGVLALTPVGLLCRDRSLGSIVKARSWGELLLMIALTLGTCYFSLSYLPFPFTFIILPLLIGAIRLPRFEAFWLFLVTTLALFITIATGLIKLKLPYDSQTGLLLHIPLLMILIPAHAMAMAMYAFRAERSRIQQSETRFRNAMEYSAIGMALVSLEGSWIQVNKSLCRFLGYSVQQMKKLSFQEITYPADLTSDLTQLNDLIDGHIESYTLEKRYIRSDGEIVWALLAVSLVRDQHDTPLYFISQIEDITDVKRSEIINQRLMERITLANEAGGVGIWEWDVDARAMNWDKRMMEIYAMRSGESTSYEYWLSRIIDEDRDMAKRTLHESLEHHKPFLLEFRIRHPNGEIRHLRAYANMLMDETNRVVRMIGVNLDMTSEVRLTDALHEEKERLHITLDSIGDAVISVDREMRVNFMNPVAESMTGWHQDNAHGQHIDSILHISFGPEGPPLPASIENQNQRAQDLSSIDSVLILNNRHGQMFDIHYSSTPLKNLKGEILGAVLVIKDVSESRQLLQQLSYNASHDILTGLPNRASFEKHLDNALLTASGQKRRHALAFIDLDKFKEINDTAGHAAGDALLLELGLLMQENIRQYDCLARLGGDEFGLILPDCGAEDARPLVQRVIDAVNNYPFYWEDKLYRIGGSAGITLISEDNCHTKEVMSQADTACYTAKHSGRGRVQLFETHQTIVRHPADQAEAFSREQIVDIIHNHLQLVVRAITPPQAMPSAGFYLVGLAIDNQEQPALNQADLLTVAAKYRLLPSIDRWLLTQIFDLYGAAIATQGGVLAIPLSLQGLSDASLVDELLLAEHHPLLKRHSLIISLNGDDFMRYYPAVAVALNLLHQHGYRIMLDQFGGDLSAFNKLPVGLIDYIKLPNRFIDNVHSSQMDDIMVRVINGHIHRLRARSIAGPVNLAATLATLQAIDIDLVETKTAGNGLLLSTALDQGYFTAR